MAEPVGEMSPSRPYCPASDDLLLMPMLGEYMLPPYALVRLLEKPPIEPNGLPLPLPNGCWFGRCALGMKINDLSVDGKMYRTGHSGNDNLTGLSRRRGGR